MCVKEMCPDEVKDMTAVRCSFEAAGRHAGHTQLMTEVTRSTYKVTLAQDGIAVVVAVFFFFFFNASYSSISLLLHKMHTDSCLSRYFKTYIRYQWQLLWTAHRGTTRVAS